MKHILEKWGLKIILTAVMAALLLLCARMNTIEPLSFRLETSAQSSVLHIFDAEDGNQYLFLPSYARLEDLRVDIGGKTNICLGDTVLQDGMDLSGFELEKGYPLRVGGKHQSTLWLYRSENVAAVYIDTGSGNMARIHEDKNYQETISVRVYTADGQLDYSSDQDYIKGRGNATWNQPKKPYLLTLSGDAPLLDMDAATKWVLLANALDETNLRNKLVLDMSRKTGNVWTPDSEYVELWLNGSYNGLYLLTEKVESGPNRLNIDSTSGDFLCKVDLHPRWDTLNAPFLTELNRTLEITEPLYPTITEQGQISDLINQLENVIISGQDLKNQTLLDLDSWVHRYLLDEISGNIDADLASSYLYYHDGTFWAGPVWDYDMTFGNSPRNQSPRAFIAKMPEKLLNERSAYYEYLMQNKSFQQRVQEIYRSVYLPELQRLTESGLAQYAQKIHAAAVSNSIRWSSMFHANHTSGSIFPTDVEQMTTWLKNREEFLTDCWLNGTPYCTVQFRLGNDGTTRNISVKQGTKLNAEMNSVPEGIWYNKDTLQLFDFDMPVTEDVILVSSADLVSSQHAAPFVLRDYIIFASIAVLVAFLLIFSGVDLYRRRKERRIAHERPHVSS